MVLITATVGRQVGADADLRLISAKGRLYQPVDAHRRGDADREGRCCHAETAETPFDLPTICFNGQCCRQRRRLRCCPAHRPAYCLRLGGERDCRAAGAPASTGIARLPGRQDRFVDWRWLPLAGDRVHLAAPPAPKAMVHADGRWPPQLARLRQSLAVTALAVLRQRLAYPTR